MIKYIFTALIICTTFSPIIYAEQLRTYNQPPVITGEFIVEQEGQKELSKLSKDTDQIEVESDFLGLKKFKKETFDTMKIKERYKEGLSKLREDESSTTIGARK
jgi:hypothetical protein